MLEDLEVFMDVEALVVVVEDAREACLPRSWSPDLGSPILVAPVFIMATSQQTTPERSQQKRGHF